MDRLLFFHFQSLKPKDADEPVDFVEICVAWQKKLAGVIGKFWWRLDIAHFVQKNAK